MHVLLRRDEKIVFIASARCDGASGRGVGGYGYGKRGAHRQTKKRRILRIFCVFLVVDMRGSSSSSSIVVGGCFFDGSKDNQAEGEEERRYFPPICVATSTTALRLRNTTYIHTTTSTITFTFDVHAWTNKKRRGEEEEGRNETKRKVETKGTRKGRRCACGGDSRGAVDDDAIIRVGKTLYS